MLGVQVPVSALLHTHVELLTLRYWKRDGKAVSAGRSRSNYILSHTRGKLFANQFNLLTRSVSKLQTNRKIKNRTYTNYIIDNR